LIGYEVVQQGFFVGCYADEIARQLDGFQAVFLLTFVAESLTDKSWRCAVLHGGVDKPCDGYPVAYAVGWRSIVPDQQLRM
jgi:hypothetical protein